MQSYLPQASTLFQGRLTWLAASLTPTLNCSQQGRSTLEHGRDAANGSVEEDASAGNAEVAEQDKAAEFAQQISKSLKGRGDRFDEMVVHEECIRLGDAGWKARYYKVIDSNH